MKNNFDDVVADVMRRKDAIVSKGIPKYDRSNVIPFTSPAANYMFYGGLLTRRMYEFFGEEGSGKTTTALDIVKNAQKYFKKKAKKGEEPKKIVWIDAENTLDTIWAQTLGVDINNMHVVILETQSAEKAYQIALDFISTGEVGLLVIDSLGALVPMATEDKSMEEKTMAGISAATSRYVSELIPLLNKTGAMAIHINAPRANFANPFDDQHTPGGWNLRMQNSAKIKFRKTDYFGKNYEKVKKSEANPVGHYVEMAIKKTKICKPDRKLGFYSLTYENGIDWIRDMITVGLELDFIHQSGNTYQFVDENGEILCDEKGKEIKCVGLNALYKFLKEEQIISEELLSQINERCKRE